ncbi:DNA primase [Atopobacter sp. AH10]|uniref:DNA primase n=1 Tax=Atopobacter sp. AH10 TaxID=2315861 RepID=UPI000EF27FD6|nr:DNA primase [Atopobacter sp. AH10]RLK63195.1 DNA primase [Atopobacter sp. AH10]
MGKKIDQTIIDQVLEATDILSLVEEYIDLKKVGRNYFGSCPFHEEKTPSFSINPEKQLYHCFSCGRGGNALGFIMEIENCSFSEALKNLADRAHLSVANQIQTQVKRKLSVDPAIDIISKASAFFHHSYLHTQGGEKARAYVKQRGMSLELQEEFQIGYAPSNRLLLSSVLPKEAIEDTELMEATGLFIPRKDGASSADWISRFYDRLIIPLRNEEGQLVGLSGRRLGEAKEEDALSSAKYINSPETRLFHKSKFLFNLDLAHKAIKSQQEVFLLEGYMDVISVYGAGIKQTVASMGTSLTSEQVKRLKQLSSTFILGYDGDKAGQKATDRAINLLLSMGVNEIYVLPLPPGMDPDEYIQRYGAESFQRHYQHKRESFVDFYLRFYADQYNLDNAHDKEIYLTKILPKLRGQTPIKRNLVFQQLSELLKVPIRLLEESFEELPQIDKKKIPFKRPLKDEVLLPMPDILTNYDRAQRQLLYRLMSDEGAWAMIQGKDISFPNEDFQVLYWFLEDYHKTYQAPFHIAHLLTFIPAGKQASLVSALMSGDYPGKAKEEEIEDLILSMTSGYQAQIKVKQLKEAIEEASRQGDLLKAKELAQQLIKTIRHSQHLEG